MRKLFLAPLLLAACSTTEPNREVGSTIDVPRIEVLPIEQAEHSTPAEIDAQVAVPLRFRTDYRNRPWQIRQRRQTGEAAFLEFLVSVASAASR